jgi:obg-like ATPase 1
VPVPDERFEWLCELYKPASRVPAFLTTIDIAGLTAGASTGAGLGNAFLSHVRAVDGIFQVVRASLSPPKALRDVLTLMTFIGAFDDAEVIHVEGDVNPLRDMEIIQNELRLKDVEWVQKTLEALKKTFRGTGTANLADKAKKEEIDTVEKVLKALTEEQKDVRKIDWTNKEVSKSSSMALAFPIFFFFFSFLSAFKG